MIRRILITYMIAVAIGLASSCVEDLPLVSEIEDTRLLGTRIELPDAPTLVWPEKGKTARISWEVVFPKLKTTTQEMQSMFIVCTPAPVNTAIPLCLEFFALMDKRKGVDQDLSDLIGFERLTCDQEQQLQSDQTELFYPNAFKPFCVKGEPSFDIAIPEQPLEDELLVLGVLCDKGKPYIDATQSEIFGCELEDGGQAIPAFFFIPLQPEDVAPNHRPNLQDATFRIDDQKWDKVEEENLLPYVLPSGSNREEFDCEQAVADNVLLEVDDEKQIMSVEFKSDSLERFDVDGETETEELKIAHYAVAGKLARPESIVRSEWEFLGFDLEWEPPRKIPKRGLLTRVFFTVRDGRGGFDSAMRAFCVTGE